MAKKLNHVWGLEIGQSAVKALRCHLEDGEVVADMFDFVEYPKILSQPEAEPEKLIADALEQFLSRNDLKGSKVGISVAGQSGLAKFFKPPPVEVKKIGDIVKYEAKQQIPFDLKDVIWDFQQMAGANIEDGYALESEVGLFAMKREAVFRALEPFKTCSVDVDIVQLAPIAIYNMISYDQFAEKMEGHVFDPEEPPKSTVVLSMGTDASDLIVTNGFRVWQRNIPIGGNHFTRQLVKDLKLTFAKAEHLKRNVMQADDPKLIFQAMRPVFNDLVTEIQRSIGFFKSLNKRADIESMLLLGNTAKLPGLQAYLNKNLGMEVKMTDKFARLSGSEVTGQPAFKENQAGFGVVYGLCLQLLNRGPMHTNLLPREIVINRLIRSKKPWVVATLSAVLLGMVANFASVYGSFANVAPEKWATAERQVTDAQAVSQEQIQKDADKKTVLTLLEQIGEQVSSNGDRRLLWMELLKVIHGGLRRDPALVGKSPTELPFSKREDFHLTRVDSVYVQDLSKWFAPLASKYAEEKSNREKLLGRITADPAPAVPGATATVQKGPVDSGWVIQLEGYHFYNGEDKRAEGGPDHIRKYLIDYFENGTILLPGPERQPTEYTLKEMGVAYPLLIKSPEMDLEFKLPNPDYERITGVAPAGGGGAAGYGGASSPYSGGTAAAGPVVDENGKEVPPEFNAPICKFVVQFAWQEKSVADRTWWRNQKTYDKTAVPLLRNGKAGAAAVATTGTPQMDVQNQDE